MAASALLLNSGGGVRLQVAALLLEHLVLHHCLCVCVCGDDDEGSRAGCWWLLMRGAQAEPCHAAVLV